ncbi:MAG: DUF262 domain-containing protein [Polyangiaceae bacterium]|nr:DUF262 domain-containing protein [Polyangiaceae bacterium]
MLSQRPNAQTYPIEDLVPLARAGKLRIPAFQRIFKWRAGDIRDFFDSIYRGFPIGTLLFWKKPAEEETFQLGPVVIDGPKLQEALWIVDGQQRLTSLVAVLAPPSAPFDEFNLHFDLAWEDEPEDRRPPSPFFFPAPRTGVSTAHMPMSVVLNSEALDSWIDDVALRNANPEYVRRARRLNKAIREYKVPAYIVESDDKETLSLIFDRVNNAGRRLERSEVFNALLQTAGTEMSLKDLRERVRALEFGNLEDDQLFKVILVVKESDITTVTNKNLHDMVAIGKAVEKAESALVKAVQFLIQDAHVSHSALLPYSFVLFALSYFFSKFPTPLPRSRALLARWVWRWSIAGEHRSERVLIIRSILDELFKQHHEEEAVQVILKSAPSNEPEHENRPFRLGSAQGKVQLLALAALGPRHLLNGGVLNVGDLVESFRSRSLHPLPSDASARSARDLSALIVHPPIAPKMLSGALSAATEEVLLSHGFSAESIDALRLKDFASATRLRGDRVRRHVHDFCSKHARWGENDRPSIAGLVGPASIDREDGDG